MTIKELSDINPFFFFFFFLCEGEQVMEMKTVTCFIILLFVTLAHVDARLGLDPTLMDQGDCQ